MTGYLLHAESKRLSPHTIATYVYAHRKLLAFVPGDTPFHEITVDQVAECLAGYPHLSKKTLSNVHAALSVMWNWAIRQGYTESNPLALIDRPRPEKRQIVPISLEEIKLLLKACDYSRAYTRPGKRECRHSRPTALRDRAIILTLVDTGLRATELCNLTIGELDRQQRHIVVFGKASKERLVPMSSQTIQAIWRYLATRDLETTMDEPLFVTARQRPLERYQLRRLVVRIADRAGVQNIYPHRFRHTFAINFLRNGGDIYSLQRILGHTTLEMVKNYLAIAEADVDAAHKRASPVANWKL
jgi:site-specific recombinase XerD